MKLLIALRSRAIPLLTLVALLLLAGGLAVKTDPATAAIVVGVIILGDLELTSLFMRTERK